MPGTLLVACLRPITRCTNLITADRVHDGKVLRCRSPQEKSGVFMPLAPGSVFAGYTIERQIGAGGMGEVYLAKHPQLPRSDALKVLPASLPGSSTAADEAFRRRFIRQAELTAHPRPPGGTKRGGEGKRG